MSQSTHSPGARPLDDVLFSINPARQEALNQKRAYQVEVEITNKCAGGCKYCYASSTTFEEEALPKRRCLELVDEVADLGIQSILWAGGDAQLHPDWFEILSYSAQRGVGTGLCISGLLSKKEAERICELERLNPRYEVTAIHIDTVDPEAYAQTNFYPHTLQKKIEGYRTLLAMGHPPQKVLPILCITRPTVLSIERTIDFFIDEMGAENIATCVFKPMGFGAEHPEYEPGLSDVRRFMEYLAKKTGQDRLITGPSPLGTVYCRTNFTIHSNGDVTPCAVLTELKAGNIYQEGLAEILERSRAMLLFDCQVKGACASCPNNSVCNGCRGNAYHYLGDIEASDPKCWMNPEAREYYLLPK